MTRRPSADEALHRFGGSVDREGLSVHGAVIRIGDDQATRRWRSDDRENLYSVSKGVCALGVGIAIDEGLLGLDARVGDAFPDLRLGHGVADVTMRDLLTMTGGIDFPWFGHEPIPWPDLAAEMLSRPSRGRVFQYSDASTYVAARMLGATVGDVRDWLLPRLFDPLGIDNPQWHRCPLGWIIGGTGLELRTEELSRIGQLLRDGGRWGDRQLVSAAWVDAMHADWVHTGNPPPMDRYGMATWAGPRDAWRLEGRYAQFVVLNGPAVITVTAHEEDLVDRIAELAVEATS